MTMLANDMASLYNVDPQQAYENLQSAPNRAGKGRSKVWLCHYRTNHQRGCMAQWTGQKRAGINEQQKYVARGIALMEQSKNRARRHGKYAWKRTEPASRFKTRIDAAKEAWDRHLFP